MRALAEIGLHKCGHVAQEAVELHRRSAETRRTRIEFVMPCAICEPTGRPGVGGVWVRGQRVARPDGLEPRAAFERIGPTGVNIWVRP